MGTGCDGRRILIRLSDFGGVEPDARPADGSPRTASRHRNGRGLDGRWDVSRPADERAMAPLPHTRRARRRRRCLPFVFGSVTVPAALVRAPPRPGNEPGVLRRRGRLDHSAALGSAADRARRLAGRLLGVGHCARRCARSAQSSIAPAARGSGPGAGWCGFAANPGGRPANIVDPVWAATGHCPGRSERPVSGG